MTNHIMQSGRASVVILAIFALLFLLPQVWTIADEPAKDDQKWTLMFDGKTIDGWSVSKIDAEKKVEIKDGYIIVGRDDLASGIKYDKPFPKSNYEIMYQAKRAKGYDFFGTLTFPVKESHCSFVTGGWSGHVIGLSSINGYDASENDTTTFHDFKDKQWYQFRVRVSDDRITVWCYPVGEDGKIVEPAKDDSKAVAAHQGVEKPKVDITTRDKNFSIRLEVTFFKPLGISTWNTEGHLRDMKFRELMPEEIEDIKQLPEN